MNTDDPRHGTNAGYIAHMFAHDTTCAPCRAAHATYKRGLWRNRYKRRVTELHIDATGTIRRIHALLALGHTLRDIDTAAGWANNGPNPGGHVHNILTQKKVHVDTATRVREAYDRLSMHLGTGVHAERSRRTAAKKGWAPPLAWDDIDTDPAPTGVAGELHPAVDINITRAHELRHLIAHGHNAETAAARLGVHRNSLHTWCARHGHDDLYWALASRGENPRHDKDAA